MDSEASPSHVRVGNRKFKAIQWFTDVVPCRMDLATHFSPHIDIHNLAVLLEEAETRTDSVQYANALSIFRADMLGDTLSLGRIGVKRVREARFDVLRLYRLLDVFSMMHGEGISAQLPSAMARATYHHKTPLGSLNDLRGTISIFSNGLQEHLKNIHDTSRGVEVDHISSSDHLLPLYMEYMESMERRKDVMSTLINFTIAAIHVGLILKGNIFVPPDFHAVVQLIVKDESDADRAAIKMLSDRTSSARRPRHFHNQLDLALTISPLLLLLPHEYTEIAGRDYLMDTWTILGSMFRPPELRAAERMLWKIIFSTATGGNLLDQLSSALPRLVDIASSASTQWINICKGPPPRNIDRDVSAPPSDPDRGKALPSSGRFWDHGATQFGKYFILIAYHFLASAGTFERENPSHSNALASRDSSVPGRANDETPPFPREKDTMPSNTDSIATE
ncbi:hypothetical protein E4T56_gene8882, partial [Termitomyces sp. T112]